MNGCYCKRLIIKAHKNSRTVNKDGIFCLINNWVLAHKIWKRPHCAASIMGLCVCVFSEFFLRNDKPRTPIQSFSSFFSSDKICLFYSLHIEFSTLASFIYCIHRIGSAFNDEDELNKIFSHEKKYIQTNT